jgi:hypothetical protein
LPIYTTLDILPFDYLNQGDAILGEILCTTNDDSDPNARVIGNFKGSVLKLGEVQNISLGDSIFFSIIGIFLLLFTSVVAMFSYLFFSSGYILWGCILTIITLGMIALTSIEIWGNILSIPNKLPNRFKQYLDYGTFSKP